MGHPDPVGSTRSADAEHGAIDSDGVARRRDAVTTHIDWSIPFGIGVWHATFIASPMGTGTWDVSAQLDPDGIGFQQCSEPCAGDPCRFWDMRGTARVRVVVSPNVATEIAADGCYRRSNCGDRTPVTVYCTLTIDASGVASISSLYYD